MDVSGVLTLLCAKVIFTPPSLVYGGTAAPTLAPTHTFIALCPLGPQPLQPAGPVCAESPARSGIEGLIAGHRCLHLCTHFWLDLMRRVVHSPVECTPPSVRCVVTRGHVVAQHGLHLARVVGKPKAPFYRAYESGEARRHPDQIDLIKSLSRHACTAPQLTSAQVRSRLQDLVHLVLF
eukprot:7282088-Prymnesium_polylepis.2